MFLFQLLSQIRLQSAHLCLGSKVWTAKHVLVVLQGALAQRALTVVLPLSQLEHLSHSAEACCKLAKEAPFALREVGLGFLLTCPVDAVDELGWNGVLLLPVFFELCPHYFVVEVLWVELGQLLALEPDGEGLTSKFVVWDCHSVAILVVLLGIAIGSHVEPGQGGECGCAVLVLVSFHVLPVDGDWQSFDSPANGVDQIEVRH